MSKAKKQTKIERIPEGVLAAYVNREITSATLALLTGMNPSYIRRAIPRIPRTRAEPVMPKTALLKARKEFRLSIADQKVSDIVQLAHVSRRTAYRIKHLRDKLEPKG